VKALQDERKELSSQNNRDSHFQSGVILAATGTFFAIEGPLNTYARAGKVRTEKERLIQMTPPPPPSS